jgi:hypothetical protein
MRNHGYPLPPLALPCTYQPEHVAFLWCATAKWCVAAIAASNSILVCVLPDFRKLIATAERQAVFPSHNPALVRKCHVMAIISMGRNEIKVGPGMTQFGLLRSFGACTTPYASHTCLSGTRKGVFNREGPPNGNAQDQAAPPSAGDHWALDLGVDV